MPTLTWAKWKRWKKKRHSLANPLQWSLLIYFLNEKSLPAIIIEKSRTHIMNKQIICSSLLLLCICRCCRLAGKNLLMHANETENGISFIVVGLKCVRPILWALNLIDQKHKKKSGVVDIDRWIGQCSRVKRKCNVSMKYWYFYLRAYEQQQKRKRNQTVCSIVSVAVQ